MKQRKYDLQSVKVFARTHVVEEIAEEFGMSVPYTRQFLHKNKITYKKKVYPVKQWLSKDIRIKAIKFLLKEGDFSLYEVANLIRCPSSFVYNTYKKMKGNGEL